MLLNVNIDSDTIGTIFQIAISHGMDIEDLLAEFCGDLAISKWTQENLPESSVHAANWLKSKDMYGVPNNFLSWLCETNKFDAAMKYIKKLSHVVYDLTIFGKVDGYPQNIEVIRSAIKSLVDEWVESQKTLEIPTDKKNLDYIIFCLSSCCDELDEYICDE